MIKLTDILTKPVINISTSTQEGIISNGIFDEHYKKLCYLSIFDNDENLEERVISTKSILSNGENALTIKDDRNLFLYSTMKNDTNKPSCINFSVYTFLGKKLGKVQDIFLDEKFNVISLLVDNKEIDIKNLISCGINTIIVQDEKEKFNIKSLKSRHNCGQKIQALKIKTEQRVFILDEENQKNDNILVQNVENLTTQTPITNQISPNSNLPTTLETIPKNKPIHTTPNLLVANYNLLVGRKVDKNIYSSTNELIAKKNTKISESTILKARVFNKTRELIKFSH